MALVKNIRSNFSTLHLWRAFNSRFAEIGQYMNLIFGSNLYNSRQPPSDVMLVASKFFELLEARNHQKEDKARLMNLEFEADQSLACCTDLSSLLFVQNEAGYNIVQTALMYGDNEVLQMIVREGVCVNAGHCSYPLHLACQLGSLSFVQYLLQSGAQVRKEAGMCYPDEHVPVRHVPSRFHFLETDIYQCDGEQLLPIMYAIQNDHVDIVKCLLTHSEDAWPSNRFALHYAAKCGAFQCMEFLVRVKPSELNRSDEEGMTPLLYSVAWGKDHVQFLVESGSNVHCKSCKKETPLHMLFYTLEDPRQLFQTAKFLLGTGLEQDINKKDCNGNSVLHALMTLVNRVVTSFSQHTAMSQQEYDQEILATVKLLLQHNCDPNTFNKCGVTALHKLLLMVDFVVSNDPTGITLDTLPRREHYLVNFKLLWQVLEMMFSWGTKPKSQTAAGRTSLMISLQTLLSVDSNLVVRSEEDLVRCISVQCQAGARPSVNSTGHKALVASLVKLGYRCLTNQDMELKQRLSDFQIQILSILLKHGLDPNYMNPVRKTAGIASGNLLTELVKLVEFVRQPSDISLIHEWILSLLQHGANPDIEPYPSESVICTSQSSIFLKSKGSQPVSQFMFEIRDLTQVFEGGHAEKLILLFVNTMDHDALYDCLGGIRFMSRFDPGDRIPSSCFMKMLNQMSSKPRSLKQIARVAIYKAIDRQLNLRVNALPLPIPIKQYLLNVE